MHTRRRASENPSQAQLPHVPRGGRGHGNSGGSGSGHHRSRSCFGRIQHPNIGTTGSETKVKEEEKREETELSGMAKLLEDLRPKSRAHWEIAKARFRKYMSHHPVLIAESEQGGSRNNKDFLERTDFRTYYAIHWSPNDMWKTLQHVVNLKPKEKESNTPTDAGTGSEDTGSSDPDSHDEEMADSPMRIPQKRMQYRDLTASIRRTKTAATEEGKTNNQDGPAQDVRVLRCADWNANANSLCGFVCWGRSHTPPIGCAFYSPTDSSLFLTCLPMALFWGLLCCTGWCHL